jgi:ankyrin repeat protein
MEKCPELARESGNEICTPVRHAVQFGKIDILKIMLEHPYDNANGETLLHVAVSYDHAEFVEFVMETPLFRKLVNVQDNKGQTALHYAVTKCNPRTVVALLSHEDIDVTVLDKMGDSAAWKLSSDMQNAKTLNWVRT